MRTAKYNAAPGCPRVEVLAIDHGKAAIRSDEAEPGHALLIVPTSDLSSFEEIEGEVARSAYGYAVGFRRHEGGTTRRIFGSAVEAASCYLEWAQIDGSVSSYATDLRDGVIFERDDRGDGVVSAGENINPAYPSDDDYDAAMPHLQAAEGV